MGENRKEPDELVFDDEAAMEPAQIPCTLDAAALKDVNDFLVQDMDETLAVLGMLNG